MTVLSNVDLSLAYSSEFPKVTHNVFRYPAKFHPPVVAAILERYVKPGATVLDPFCGSGTTNLEAALRGHPSIGFDCDPLAIFVSRTKVDARIGRDARSQIESFLCAHRFLMNTCVFERHTLRRSSARTWKARAEQLASDIPLIPNIEHWYHPDVLLDLAELRRAIRGVAEPRFRRLLVLTFAAVSRSASYADPVPVSGLEVTHHMRSKIEAGFTINVAELFLSKLKKNVAAFEELANLIADPEATFICTDSAARWPSVARSHAIVTSPPYQTAVDYYRRHTLETYWLGFVAGRDDRRLARDSYLGRSRVPKSHVLLQEKLAGSATARALAEEMSAADPQRARDLQHYVVGMRRFFSNAAAALRRDEPLIVVVGNSRWRNRDVPTDLIMEELAAPLFTLDEKFSYPLKNRYMSYSRHNGANISHEYGLVLRRV